MTGRLKVTHVKVYAVQCDCGEELANPQTGSLNWPDDETADNGQKVVCPMCCKKHTLPKALQGK